MSSEVKVRDAKSAIEVANTTLRSAGHGYITIYDVHKENDNWIVVAKTIIDRVTLVISNSGDVLSMSSEQSETKLRPEPK